MTDNRRLVDQAFEAMLTRLRFRLEGGVDLDDGPLRTAGHLIVRGPDGELIAIAQKKAPR